MIRAENLRGVVAGRIDPYLQAAGLSVAGGIQNAQPDGIRVFSKRTGLQRQDDCDMRFGDWNVVDGILRGCEAGG